MLEKVLSQSQEYNKDTVNNASQEADLVLQECEMPG